MYRTIVLSDVEEDVETTKHKVHRLLDQNDSISQYVRHLRIHGRQRGLGIQRLGVYKPDSEIINATDLEKIIGKVRNLQHFRYGTPIFVEMDDFGDIKAYIRVVGMSTKIFQGALYHY